MPKRELNRPRPIRRTKEKSLLDIDCVACFQRRTSNALLRRAIQENGVSPDFTDVIAVASENGQWTILTQYTKGRQNGAVAIPTMMLRSAARVLMNAANEAGVPWEGQPSAAPPDEPGPAYEGELLDENGVPIREDEPVYLFEDEGEYAYDGDPEEG